VIGVQGGPEKWATDSWPQFCQNLNRFKKIIGRFLGKFVVKWILKIPLHLAYVATCETLMSAKQAINDKLQGSVATYLRCSVVVNNQIRKCFLLSLSAFF